MLITDRLLMDHSEFDVYFQNIYEPDYSFLDWRNLIRENHIPYRQKLLVIAIGNNSNTMDEGVSPKNQMVKLLKDVLHHMPWVEKVTVTSAFPRGDAEVLYQDRVKNINIAFGSAVQFIKTTSPVAKKMVSFLPTHKLFLEEHEFFDFNTGGISQQIRIIKPVTIYFEPDQPKLNSQGLAHYRSYVLIRLGLLDRQVNTWQRMPKHRESPTVRRALTCAWVMAQQEGNGAADSTPEADGSRAPHNTPNTTDSDDNKATVSYVTRVPPARGQGYNRCPGDRRQSKD